MNTIATFMGMLAQKAAHATRFAAVLLLHISSQARAQEPWTLQKCLLFYQNNSLEVRQQGFATEKANLQLKATKRNFLPVVDTRWRSVSNWGFLIDPSTNILSRQFNMGNQAFVNANWNLFNGAASGPLVRLRAQELVAAECDYRALLNAVALKITLLYLQALLAEEQLSDAKQRVAHLQAKKRQIERQVAQGILHLRDALNINSQLAYADAHAVEAESSLENAEFTLMQAMGLRQAQLITLEKVEVPEHVLTATYANAAAETISEEAFPELLAARTLREAAATKILAVQYTKLPIVSVAAQWATRTSNFQRESVGTQFVNNLNQQAGFNLIIPLFSNSYRTDLALAKVDQAAAETAYLQTQENIRQQLFEAGLAYRAAVRKYLATQSGYKAVLEENRFAEKQLQLGAISAVDYGEVQSRLASTKSELTQNKYDLYFKLKVLNHFQDPTQPF